MLLPALSVKDNSVLKDYAKILVKCNSLWKSKIGKENIDVYTAGKVIYEPEKREERRHR